MALLHRLPVQSGEQAVTLKEGQEIVGTWRVTAASATSRRKAPTREQHGKLCEEGERNQRGSRRTMQKWMWHHCSAIGLGGNPKVCRTGVRAGPMKQLIDKKQGPVPKATFPTPLVYIYTSLVEALPLWLVRCVFVFPYLCGRASALVLSLIPALFWPFDLQTHLLICWFHSWQWSCSCRLRGEGKVEIKVFGFLLNVTLIAQCNGYWTITPSVFRSAPSESSFPLSYFICNRERYLPL